MYWTCGCDRHEILWLFIMNSSSSFKKRLPLLGYSIKLWVTSRIRIKQENIHLQVLFTNIAWTATTLSGSYVVYGFFIFFGFMVSTVAYRQNLINEKWENTDGLTLKLFTCIQLVYIARLTPWTLSWWIIDDTRTCGSLMICSFLTLYQGKHVMELL